MNHPVGIYHPGTPAWIESESAWECPVYRCGERIGTGRAGSYLGAQQEAYRIMAQFADTDAGEIAALATTGPEESAVCDRLEEILGGYVY